MKKVLTILLCFVAILFGTEGLRAHAAVAEPARAEADANLRGTSYTISTAEQLANVANDLSGSYTLVNDIDLSGYADWAPIGVATGDQSFMGYFNGQGHTIRGLTMTGSGYSYSGLFGVVTGRVENLNVEITVKDANTAGGLVGYLNGGTVECCSAAGSVSGQNDLGGLVGLCQNGTIRNCYATASVTSTSETQGDGCGGLVGEMYGNSGNARVFTSYAAGKVVKTGTTGVGGIVGYRHTYLSSSATSIIASYYNISTTKMGDEGNGFGVTGTEMRKQATFANWDFDNIWGIDSNVNSGYPYLKLTGAYEQFQLRGAGTKASPYLIGTEAELAAIARGEVTNSFTACFKLTDDLTLSSKYWTPIGGNGMPEFSGTFDGDGNTIFGLDIAFPAYTYEGLFGTVTGTVKNLNVVGTVSDAFTAGTVVGYLDEGVVECCSGDGSVGGRNDLGGLVGLCQNGTIRNCYATASVTSTSETQGDGCGGLVGDLYGYSGNARVFTSYAAGKVVKTGTTGVGGIVGYRHTYLSSSATSIIASYYNISTTKMGDEGNGFGVTGTEMRKQATFANWDFDNIWGIDSNVNSGYPYLKLTGEYNTFEPDGSGTSRDPYIIYTEAELAAIARGEVTNSFTAYYMLGADLTLGSKYWTPIGGNGMPVFSGIFDGDGHTISGLDIAFPAYTYEGLFGTVTGTVKNLNVVGTVSDAFTAGTVVGYLDEGVVECCSGGGSVGGRNDLGGLVGLCQNGTIRNCYATASVTSTSEKQADGCGGLVGDLYGNSGNARVFTSYATGNIVKTGTTGVGGIVGYRHTYLSSSAASIIASYYDRNTTSMTDKQSGFGLETAQMKKKATFANWDFANIWGISSSVNNGYPYLKLTGEYNTFELEGSGTSRDPYIIYTEAELAAVARGEVTNSFTSYYMLGADLALSSNYWTPIGGNGMPAFSGTFDGDGHTISNMNIAVRGYSDSGLFGYVTGTVQNLRVTGSISDANGGGLLVDTLNGGIVERCASLGSISGTGDLGGLVGLCQNGTISNCYSRASVTSGSSNEADGCGGLVGELYGNSGAASISSSYATGKIAKTGAKGAGGLVGYRHTYLSSSSATVTSCYYDNYAEDNADKGTHKTTAEMKQRATYGDWDFNTIWAISSSTNSGYPYLQIIPDDVPAFADPDAPTNVQATLSGSGIRVTWDAVDGATKYRLYRTVDGTTTNRYVTEPIYTDTDVVAGKTYIYYVKTYSDMANSGNSAKVSITVSVVPDAPTGVKVTSSLSGITVTWNAVPGVTKYRVIRTVDGVTTKTKVSGTSWTDTAPVADANNVYSVQAQAADGTYSTVSESKSLYYPLGIAVKVSGSKANLSWTPVTGATKYQVYRRPQVNGKYGAWELIYSAKGTSFVDTPGAGIWQYRVRAVVDGVKTGYSNRKKVTVG